MQQPSEEIKSRLDIVDVLREYINLKPAGINFSAICPFHREKTPSFMVSPDKQIWHCFGCGKGGDIFSFIMEMEGISFVEALRVLAPRAGVVLEKQDSKITSQRNRLMDILDFAQKYYHKVLMESGQAKSAREYLSQRGLKDDILDEWMIGYSPDSWDDLINLLLKNGYKENEIFLAGLSVKSNASSKFYNRFRSRIMFPINDAGGNICAFSARVLPEKEDSEKMGKYINSPQTMIYDKSKILFGLDKAKTTIKNEKLAIIVEGQMDVITAHQNGFKNIIASSGTALTNNQIILLKRYSNNIALAFDMDDAGQRAADRGIREAMSLEMNIKVINMPGGKDPDEFIKKNPKEWISAVKKAKPMMQYYFDKIFSGINLEEAEAKRRVASKLLPIISDLGNKIEQDFWIKKLSEKINIGENILRETLEANLGQKNSSKYAQEEKADESNKKTRISREEMMSELLIALALKFSTLIEYIVNHINIDEICGFSNKTIYKNLIIYYNNIIENKENEQDNNTNINYNEFRYWLKNDLQLNNGDNDNQLKLLDKLVLLSDKDFYDIEREQAKNEIIKIIINLKRYYLTSKMKEIEKLIGQAEKEGDNDRVKVLMLELKLLSDEIKNIK